MCDIKKYADIYEEIKKLNDDDEELVLAYSDIRKIFVYS